MVRYVFGAHEVACRGFVAAVFSLVVLISVLVKIVYDSVNVVSHLFQVECYKCQ